VQYGATCTRSTPRPSEGRVVSFIAGGARSPRFAAKWNALNGGHWSRRTAVVVFPVASAAT
jgi:hypothetical protein